MANLFRSVRPTRLKRNPFNLSHDVKLTTDFGRLTPVLCKEVVPGDSWRIRSEMLIRTAPLFAPLMHRVNAYVHYYFVPSRLLMKDFETFITGGPDGTGRIKERFSDLDVHVEKPYVRFSDLVKWFRDGASDKKKVLQRVFGQGSLFDYLGYPALDSQQINQIVASSSTLSDKKIDVLPFRAYELIWNEYYRDQNFEKEADILADVNGDVIAAMNRAVADGAVTTGDIMTDMVITRQRNWEKDYFTSALPWPQRGMETTIGEGGDLNVSNDVDPDGYETGVVDNKVNLEDIFAHVSSTVNVPVTSINELRRALAIQKFRERLARYGSRYTEFLRGVFGVHPKDSRLQRPEFLGGFKQQLQFGEVLQTSETSAESPQGSYAGTGFSLSGGKYIKRYFDEHGYIIGILSIMPKPAYMQGWPREFDRFDKLDYYLPDFAHLGEQDIRRSELVFNPVQDAHNGALFGYIPRYAEYKFCPSRVCGMMRTNLDFWHLARRLKSTQMLNGSFLLLDQKEMDRVFNMVGDEDNPIPAGNDHFWLQVYHDIKAVRPMPKFGTPLL